MNEHASLLQAHFGSEPAAFQDLLTYFDRIGGSGLAGDEQTEVNLLQPADCIAATEDMESHPLFETEAGANFLVLDEANTSDYHCYAIDFPYPGCVVFVPHGDNVQVVFRNLIEYVKACETAIETDSSLRDYHRSDLLLYPDQTKLHDLMTQLLDEGPDEFLYLLVSAYDLSDNELNDRLLSSDDFYLRASVADRIASGPKRDLYDYATRCANDPHPNVWRPGRRALGAVEAMLRDKPGG